jgi:thiamine-phosphate pyrophosphorylase
VTNEFGILAELFNNGLEIFHFRKPGLSREQTTAGVAKIPRHFHDRVVLHDHHRLVEHYNLKGIHFNETRRKEEFDRIAEIRKEGTGLNLSASFHRIADVKQHGAVFDYVFLSPVFDSISKKNYTAAFDPSDLNAFLTVSLTPVIALGGVDAIGITAVRKMGFSGAAVLGAVWEADDPVDAFLQIKQAAEAARS